MIEPFEPCEHITDYHAVYSIQICELVNSGFDVFGDPRWPNRDWLNDAVKKRIEDKFISRYWYREIGIMPPGEWRHELTRVMGEILPKYKAAYALASEGITPFAVSDEYGKERNVYSDFPATQINAEVNDYAKNANDRQYERVTNGDFIDKMEALQTRYNDIDAALLDDLEVVFSCLITVAINGL